MMRSNRKKGGSYLFILTMKKNFRFYAQFNQSVIRRKRFRGGGVTFFTAHASQIASLRVKIRVERKKMYNNQHNDKISRQAAI